MTKHYITAAIIAALGVGFGAGCLYCCSHSKIAVIDVPVVVSKSELVQALRADQNSKAQELAKWLQNAQEDVKGEKDKEKQEALLQQYNAEFAQKKEELTAQYAKDLKDVDESITKAIVDEAKKRGYNIVVPKNILISGGDDITEEVSKVVK